jgi:RNA polymerase sigma factor (sigma-70 family)
MEDRRGLKPLLQRVLADRGRTRDPDAWNELLARLRPLIWASLVNRVAQDTDASDLTHNVQLEVLRVFDRFKGETIQSFLAWVDRITVAVLSKYWHHQPPREGDPLTEDPPVPEPEPPPFDVDQIGRVLQAVEKLPSPHREIVQAFYLKGQSCVKIAAQMQRTRVWVSVNKMHAVRALRTLLGGDHAS